MSQILERPGLDLEGLRGLRRPLSGLGDFGGGDYFIPTGAATGSWGFNKIVTEMQRKVFRDWSASATKSGNAFMDWLRSAGTFGSGKEVQLPYGRSGAKDIGNQVDRMFRGGMFALGATPGYPESPMHGGGVVLLAGDGAQWLVTVRAPESFGGKNRGQWIVRIKPDSPVRGMATVRAWSVPVYTAGAASYTMRVNVGSDKMGKDVPLKLADELFRFLTGVGNFEQGVPYTLPRSTAEAEDAVSRGGWLGFWGGDWSGAKPPSETGGGVFVVARDNQGSDIVTLVTIRGRVVAGSPVRSQWLATLRNRRGGTSTQVTLTKLM